MRGLGELARGCPRRESLNGRASQIRFAGDVHEWVKPSEFLPSPDRYGRAPDLAREV